ncbi:hypothetical protein C5S39_04760 [Candidatus Methanophagaceae archaeon]|jgi:hypothetical protein|nr:hypothetical protein C5S39_04760 [Methanophagales archaeon]
MIAEYNYITGLVEVLDVKSTIDIALKLHPEIRKIVVTIDGTQTGLAQRKLVHAVAEQEEYKDVEFVYLFMRRQRDFIRKSNTD